MKLGIKSGDNTSETQVSEVVVVATLTVVLGNQVLDIGVLGGRDLAELQMGIGGREVSVVAEVSVVVEVSVVEVSVVVEVCVAVGVCVAVEVSISVEVSH